jgi:putative NADH-flavin reductase
MKIAIFGATGRTGLLTVYQALDKGHIVTAFARNPAKLAITHANIRVIQGDILDYSKVKAAVEGQDAVISVLGVESRKPTTVLSEGTKNILQAMSEYHVDRFICMSSAGILGNDAGFIFGKIIIPLLLREVFKDKIRQMKIIQDSSVDWVIIRPTGLTDSPKTGKYKILPDAPESRTVPRADVADFMLKLLTDKHYDRQMPAISG